MVDRPVELRRRIQNKADNESTGDHWQLRELELTRLIIEPRSDRGNDRISAKTALYGFTPRFVTRVQHRRVVTLV
jgi:hypothetical protein